MIEQSAEIGELAKSLVRAQKRFKVARKTSRNPHFKSDYADLGEVVGAVLDVCLDEGISILQIPALVGERRCIATTLVHTSGQWIRGYYEIVAVKNDPQSVGAATTYARRFGLSAMLTVVADDDDDGESERRRGAEPEPTREATPADDHEARIFSMIDSRKFAREKIEEEITNHVDGPAGVGLTLVLAAYHAKTSGEVLELVSKLSKLSDRALVERNKERIRPIYAELDKAGGKKAA